MQGENERESLVAEPLYGIDPEKLSAVELLSEIGTRIRSLAQKELELARAEVMTDLRSQLAMAKAFGVAAVAGLCALNLFLVALVFALAGVMSPGIAALALGGVVLAVAVIAGAIGWQKRLRAPLERTRRSLKESVEWTKDQIR